MIRPPNLSNSPYPVLVIQGNRDVQVAVRDAELLKAAKPNAQLRFFASMNHGFKDVKTNSMQEAMTSYNDPKLSLTPGLASAIAGFVKRSLVVKPKRFQKTF